LAAHHSTSATSCVNHWIRTFNNGVF